MDHNHWRQSPLNRTGALQGGDGEFWGIFTPFYTINFRGGHKSGGARATAASASLAPLIIMNACIGKCLFGQQRHLPAKAAQKQTFSGYTRIVYFMIVVLSFPTLFRFILIK